jgi:hypothetical protein
MTKKLHRLYISMSEKCIFLQRRSLCSTEYRRGDEKLVNVIVKAIGTLQDEEVPTYFFYLFCLER